VLKIHRIQGPCSFKVQDYKLKVGKIGEFSPKNANSETFVFWGVWDFKGNSTHVILSMEFVN
jgi:hypothetical protein